MEAQISWDKADTQILWVRFENPFTKEEYLASCLAAIEEIEQVDFRVHVIFYVDTSLPPDNLLPAIRTIFNHIQNLSNLGIVISVYPNNNIFMTFAMQLSYLVLQVYAPELKAQFPFVKTIEEAYHLIAAQSNELSI